MRMYYPINTSRASIEGWYPVEILSDLSHDRVRILTMRDEDAPSSGRIDITIDSIDTIDFGYDTLRICGYQTVDGKVDQIQVWLKSDPKAGTPEDPLYVLASKKKEGDNNGT